MTTLAPENPLALPQLTARQPIKPNQGDSSLGAKSSSTQPAPLPAGAPNQGPSSQIKPQPVSRRRYGRPTPRHQARSSQIKRSPPSNLITRTSIRVPAHFHAWP